jgi:hypothetical protein
MISKQLVSSTGGLISSKNPVSDTALGWVYNSLNIIQARNILVNKFSF